MIKVKKLNEPDFNDIKIKSYLPEVIKGIGVTSKHFFKNLFGRKLTPTIQYPEQKKTYAPRFRGRHRLMKNEDGTVRCVACMNCATNCPSQCITIIAGESPDKSKEKYPVVFEINLLLCVFCGLCVEACPCDAIRMDTGEHAAPMYSRNQSVFFKEDLLKDGGISTAPPGGKYR